MLGGDEAWIGEWSSAKGDAGRVGDSVTAPPGGSPPGLLNPGQKPLVKDEYQFGMMEGDETWSAGWCTATKGDAGKVGDPVTAPPGGSPPGLLSPGPESSQVTGFLKDVVHEVEWDGQKWIAIHHPNG
eukprot:6047908-Amphidinium_carterae.1